jgi:sarcosine oxidase subunit beta
VVGGGIIGISTAYHLAESGNTDVTVVEALDIAQGLTGLSSGGVRSQFGSREETQLSLRSLVRWGEIEHKRRVDLELRRVGYLSLLSDESEVRAFAARLEMQRDLGLFPKMLQKSELVAMLPGLTTDDLESGVLTECDGYASPADVTMILAQIAKAEGVTLMSETYVEAIRIEGGRVIAVETTRGLLPCDVVVNASGNAAPSVAYMVGVNVPLLPVPMYQFLTEPTSVSSAPFPCTQDVRQRLYLRPEGQSVLLGMEGSNLTSEGDPQVTWAVLEALATKIAHRWPRLNHVGIARTWVGMSDRSPDGRPFIDQLTEPSGFILGCGFSGHGFMHGLAAGEAMADLVERGEARHVDLTPFRLDRVLG